MVNAGLWAWATTHLLPTVDQAVISLVGLVMGFVSLKARAWFGVSISAAMQDQLRQSLSSRERIVLSGVSCL